MVQLILVQLPDFLNGHSQWHLEPLKNSSHGNNGVLNVIAYSRSHFII